MKSRKRLEMETFVENQKSQLGLNDSEAEELLQQVLMENDDFAAEEAEPVYEKEQLNLAAGSVADFPAPAAQVKTPEPPLLRKKTKRSKMSDPYLTQSQTVKARPTRVSRMRSLLYEHALPNEYIVQIGVKGARPVLGGKFLKFGKKFLKFPAAVQTVYFTSDNANKNYQGLRIDGYACWRIDPEKPELAAGSLDFSDQENPMGNTNRILQTICTEAIRHIIANTGIEDALTKKDEIGRDLKSQLERIERTWGITFDQVGIERVTILSSQVFDDLQQKTRDLLRLAASESRMNTDRDIEKKRAEHTKEMDLVRRQAEKEGRILRATSESEIHKVEMDEKIKRETEERRAEEEKRKAEVEAAERAAQLQAEMSKLEATRAFEIQVHQDNEKRKLEMAMSANEAQAKIKAVETEARAAEAMAESELAMAETRSRQKLKEQEIKADLEKTALEFEQDLEARRQEAELNLANQRFQRKMAKRREEELARHEAGVMHLERMRQEEETLNLVSETRVLAELMHKLPDIAASLKIDRYTVLDGSGHSPLVYTLKQIFTLMDEHGLGRYLKERKPEEE